MVIDLELNVETICEIVDNRSRRRPIISVFFQTVMSQTQRNNRILLNSGHSSENKANKRIPHQPIFLDSGHQSSWIPDTKSGQKTAYIKPYISPWPKSSWKPRNQLGQILKNQQSAWPKSSWKTQKSAWPTIVLKPQSGWPKSSWNHNQVGQNRL